MSGAPDLMLLGLFRTEAEAGAAVLVSGIAGGDTHTPFLERLPTLLRAAHSVKGAARIVGLDTAAKLAGALEDALAALQEAGCPPTPAQGAALRETATLLAGFGDPARDPSDVSAECAERLPALLDVLAERESPAPGRAATRAVAAPAAPQPPPVSARPTIDAALADLFRIEVESGTAVLSSGLIALEQNPRSAEDWEAVLRAAHSIKGAARILGLESFEQLVHVLEDQLLAARDSSEGLAASGVDRLLEAVDTMKSSGHALDATGAGLDALEARCASLAAALAAERGVEGIARESSGAAAAPEPPPDPAERRRHISIVPPLAVEPSAVADARPQRPATPPSSERVLRVAAQSIDRLMGLAGESLVEARRVAELSKVLDRIQRRQRALIDALSAIEAETASHPAAATLRLLAGAKGQARDCLDLVGAHAVELEGYTRRAEELSERLYREALKSRMRPFSDGTQGFPRLVRDLARKLDKSVRFELVGGKTEVDRDVLENLEAPLNHLLRNAIDHGIEAVSERASAGKPEDARLRLEARHHAGQLVITVSDDGRGIDAETIRAKAVKRKLVAPALATNLSRAELLDFLFLPGFTTTEVVTEVSGRGIGLDVVKTMVETAGGSVRVTSELGVGTSFHLQLPVTRSVARALVAEIAGESYAFPLLRIERVLRIPRDRVRTLEGDQYFVLDDANVALVGAAELLGFGGATRETSELSVVVIGDNAQRFGLVVDGFSGEQDLVVRPLDARLGKIQDIAAAALLADGSPALIVDVDDLLRSIDRAIRTGSLGTVGEEAPAERERKRILVVDDSITVREAERQLLVNRGYDVEVAVDGMDALNSLRRSRYDLVITDVDMPRLNGIELVRTLKQDQGLKAIPIVVVSYKDRGEDRLRGLDAGANYYLTKSSFHDEKLVDAVEDLIGAVA